MEIPGEELPKGWLAPEEDALVPPRKLWIGPKDSISHYYRWIWEYLAYLTLLCNLKRDHSVLELGCGHGRTARGLLSYLRYPGLYIGLDVNKEMIEDAKQRIEARWPNFRFIYASIYSRNYNSDAQNNAASYVFPFKPESFDVIYAASLFTHLLPDETLNYFIQSNRVLRKGGKCLFSFFILDYYMGPGTTISPAYEFESKFENYDGVRIKDPKNPDNLIGYSLKTIMDYASRSGFEVKRVIPGLWSEKQMYCVNEQDLVVLIKKYK